MFVFGYGSLLWNPGFAFDERLPALAKGWTRRWCVSSTVHRGTLARPGCVLGLVPGGECVGAAYRLPEGSEDEALRYLHEREMCEEGYRMETIGLVTSAGRVPAVCYVADRPSPPADLALAIRTAKGTSGTNLEYAEKAAVAVAELKLMPGWPPACPGFEPDFLGQCGVPSATEAIGAKNCSLAAMS